MTVCVSVLCVGLQVVGVGQNLPHTPVYITIVDFHFYKCDNKRKRVCVQCMCVQNVLFCWWTVHNVQQDVRSYDKDGRWAVRSGWLPR